MWSEVDGEDSPGGRKDSKRGKGGRGGSDSDTDIRMGSWGGTGSALLEPPGGSSNGPADESGEGPDAPPTDEEPPKVSSETLNMLNKCWDASNDERD
mmetsp:Transcript_16895/g.36683  ORF Transcript_16895/g.36683 Transcript_16895/m.36683 type:complete len:97 (+) Transcript_16895:1-291(+)